MHLFLAASLFVSFLRATARARSPPSREVARRTWDTKRHLGGKKTANALCVLVVGQEKVEKQGKSGRKYESKATKHRQKQTVKISDVSERVQRDQRIPELQKI